MKLRRAAAGGRRGCLLAATMLVAASALTAPAQSTPRARALLQVQPGGVAGERVVVLRIVGEGPALASYQGAITFNRRQLAVVGAVAPGDGYRIVNMADTTDGRLRFAGFATTGFAHDTALTLRVRVLGASGALTVKLDVVGDVLGKPFPASGLGGTTVTIPAARR